MQNTTDPGEPASENLATSLSGELERIRFILLELGKAIDPTIVQWYESVASDLANLSGGNTFTGTQTFSDAVVFNGTNNIMPTGVVLPYTGLTSPTGFLLCNGAEADRTTFADLFTLIGVEYGAGDGSTTFNVPDYRGMFIRGFANIADETFTVNTTTENLTTGTDHEFFRDGIPVRLTSTGTLPAPFAVDTTYYTIHVDANEIQLATSYANALAGTAINITDSGSGTHTISEWLDPDASGRDDRGDGTSGDNIGTRQADEFASHTHQLGHTGFGAAPGGLGFSNTTGTNFTTTTAGGNETRPHNIYANYIIKT